MPMPRPGSRCFPACLILLALVAQLPLGCRPKDQVRSYTVPKETPGAAAPPAGAGSMLAGGPNAMAAIPDGGRMIAAMLRGDRQAWFFKAVAPPEQMDAAADSILAFLRSVQFDEAEGRPTWTTPADWQELPASGMRLATLKVPEGDESIDLSVIGLGLTEGWDAQVLDNVNRWRGQLGMAPAKTDAMAELETIDVAGRPLVIADLHAGDPPSTPQATTDGQAAAKKPAEDKPAEKPATEQPAPKNPWPEAGNGPLSYKLPEGWVELPTNTMRLANLTVGEGEAKAAVTGFAFSASAPQWPIRLRISTAGGARSGCPPPRKTNSTSRLSRLTSMGWDRPTSS